MLGLESWLIDDYMAEKSRLMDWPKKRQSHRWSVITVNGDGEDALLEVVMQTTSESFRRGGWMSSSQLSAEEAAIRAPVVKELQDGRKVYLPLTDRGPRTISLRALESEAFGKRSPSDDIPTSLCGELRDGIAAAPEGVWWNLTKMRWGVLGNAHGCPGCRACEKELGLDARP